MKKIHRKNFIYYSKKAEREKKSVVVDLATKTSYSLINFTIKTIYHYFSAELLHIDMNFMGELNEEHAQKRRGQNQFMKLKFKKFSAFFDRNFLIFIAAAAIKCINNSPFNRFLHLFSISQIQSILIDLEIAHLKFYPYHHHHRSHIHVHTQSIIHKVGG